MGLASLQILVRCISQRENIKVRISNSASTASTNGKEIVIPYRWTMVEEPEAENLLIGILAHEGAGHIRHTDISVFSACPSPLHKTILNILEDIRIENRVIEERPFFGPVLAEVVTYLDNKEGFFSFDEEMSGLNLLVSSLLVCGRAWCIKWQYAVLRKQAKLFYKVALRNFGSLWSQVFRIAINAKKAKSTSHALDLTNQILDLIKDLAESDDQNPQVFTLQESIANGDVCNIKTELNDLLEDALQQISNVSSGFDSSGFGSSGFLPEINDHRELIQANESVKRLRKQISLLSKDIGEKFEAERQVNRAVTRNGKKLSVKHLHRVRLDNPNIFRSKRTEIAIDTSVLFLIDTSYSMISELESGETRMDAANALMLGFGDMLEELGVEYKLSCFSNVITSVKEYDEENFGHSEYCCFSPKGGTETGQAIIQNLPDLICRPSSRKIIICVTDGEADTRVLCSAYEEASRNGIEIVNIFIGQEISEIREISDRFGFSSKTCNDSFHLNRYLLSVFSNLLDY